MIKDLQYLTQIILDSSSSVLVDSGPIEMDKAMLVLIEKWSGNVCFVLHPKQREIMGVAIRK